MKNFKAISPSDIKENFIDLIGTQWMLITAGNGAHHNTMTASWGGVGEMWGLNMAMVVIRPQRYTREFVDNGQRLTLSFLAPQYKKALAYCGAHSGRDGDKLAACGLTVEYTPQGTPAVAEARLVLECRKLYVGEFREDEFTDKTLIEKWYPQRDFHKVYFCQIEKAYVTDSIHTE